MKKFFSALLLAGFLLTQGSLIPCSAAGKRGTQVRMPAENAAPQRHHKKARHPHKKQSRRQKKAEKIGQGNPPDPQPGQ